MALKIGIIGAGLIGSVLAKAWTSAGHSVKIANSRGPETLGEQEKQTGATAVKIEDAVKNVDVVVVSIPFQAVSQLPKGLFSDAPKDLVIIDTNNYHPEIRDEKIEALESFSTTESELVSQLLGRPVIKAFNNITDFNLRGKAVPTGTKGRVALPVSGDDASAKKIVISLINDSGFDAHDVGALSESWRQQPGAPSYGTDLTLEQIPAALALTERKKNPEIRAITIKKWAENPEATPEERTQMFRDFAYPTLLQ